MNKIFDGKKIRDKILVNLKKEIEQNSNKPKLAVIWAGNDFASEKYIKAKRGAAEKCGIGFDVFRFEDKIEPKIVLDKVKQLNEDKEVTGILVQMPLPENVDAKKVIEAIEPEKDVDGLRFCSDMVCSFRAPVTLAILKAISESGKSIEMSKIAIIGQGFLVGAPLTKILQPIAKELRIADSSAPYIGTFTVDADIVISATGKGNIIQPEMVKQGAVLIDAGTTEMKGELTGDIDPKCYEKASYYTPVPGGIGPVTVAMLLSNVVEAFKLQNEKR